MSGTLAGVTSLGSEVVLYVKIEWLPNGAQNVRFLAGFTLKDPSEFSTKKKQKMRDDWLPGGVGRNRTHDRIHASHALERFQSVSGTWCETKRQKEFAVGTQSHGNHADADCGKICVFEELAM